MASPFDCLREWEWDQEVSGTLGYRESNPSHVLPTTPAPVLVPKEGWNPTIGLEQQPVFIAINEATPRPSPPGQSSVGGAMRLTTHWRPRTADRDLTGAMPPNGLHQLIQIVSLISTSHPRRFPRLIIIQ
jgi:hypothetical protein